MKNHIMVDLETLGTGSKSIITSISAVAFNPKTGETANNFFETHINVESSVKFGLKFSSKTVLWWLEQNDNARKLLIDGQKNSVDLAEALNRFKNWIYIIASDNNISIDDIYIWGNSPRFDLGLLHDAYSVIDLNIPWNFRNERDIRTIIGFKPENKINHIFEGLTHYGIDDCKNQIKYLVKTLNDLNLFDGA